ncbi:MAG TPA: branched-chain amino acid ABC transporter permease [Xanthobacteraceae bacterium]|nr:branched-chain amino acid ABC transporter permease [Xanthobacteraceae bacterium]
MSLSAFLQFVFSGLTSGAVYAFVALAFSVTFSSSGIVNFAQGQFVMLGGMVAASLHAGFDVPVLPAMMIGVAAAGIAGLVMGAGFILPMLRLGEFTLILITLGLSIVFEAVALIVWGTDPLALSSLIDAEPLRLGGASLTIDSVIIIAMIFVTLIGYQLFARFTRWGRAMRATSIDPSVAASLGVNVSLTIVLAFVLSAVFGGLAGVLLTPLISTGAQTGLLMTLKGFTAAVLGGMGSPIGSVAGGFLLGMIEAMTTGFISSTYQNAIALTLLILFLMVRPEGLFTKRSRQA